MLRYRGGVPARSGSALLPGVWDWPGVYSTGRYGAASPFQWLRRMDQEFDRLFSSFFEGSAGSPHEPVSAASWAPRVAVRESAEEYLIQAELPGVNPEDIEVTTTGPVLTIQGRARQEWQEERNGGTSKGHRAAFFQQSFPLPPTVQADAVTAEYRHGLLEVHLPKTEEAKQQYRRIPILTGQAQAQPALEGQMVDAPEAGAKGGEVSSPGAGKKQAARSTRRAPKAKKE